MIKRILLIVILAVAVVAAAAGTPAPEAEAGKLSDLGEAAWARQEIAEMNALGIITGYPEGVFSPYKNVTIMEAVVMLIRAIGLEEQARSLDDASVDYEMPQGLTWGRGYLIAAVQRGMLDGANLYQFKPGEPATRLEVALLTYYALKLNSESSPLAFADAGQIPQERHGHIAALVNNDIMRGLPGNLFCPYEYNNRAQMAVLLSRIIGNKFADPYPDRRLSGTISSVDLNSQLLSIQPGGNKFFTSDCEVFIDGNSAAPADLNAGDEAELILDESGQAVFIKAHRQKDYTSYKGKVESLFPIAGEYWLALVDFGGNNLTRPVAGGVGVNEPGGRRDISSLSEGEFVEIKVSDNKIIEINSLDCTTLSGKVESVQYSSLTLRDDSGEEYELDVPGNVVVMKNGGAMTYEGVMEGDLVEVSVYDEKALKIDVLRSGEIEGEIEELDTSGTWGITIVDDDGDTEEYTVDDDVEVERDGRTIDFEDLDEGERVRLELDSDDYVIYIEVLDEDDNGEIEGEIEELDTSGTWGITIVDDDGDTEEYTVDDDVEVERDGRTIDFEDLDEGERVRLELDSDDYVIYIEVLDEDDNGEIEGEIEELDTSGTWGITIVDDDGDTEEYTVDDDVEVERDGRTIDFEDLDEGEWVRLELNSRDIVVGIEADEEVSIIKGVVKDLTTDSSQVIIRLVREDNGRTAQYDVTSDTVCARDDDDIDLDEVIIGAEVEVRVRDGEAERIKVTNDEDITVEGEVTSVDTSRERITIRQVNGNKFTFDFAADYDLEDDEGDRITELDDVEEGWDVKLELENGEVEKLTQE
ncbi:MAG TPA: S-layer homology domain-containing protein [Bacillota bacterium]|nr:S-layer homology domain-containing protein [Bacillota bacterium]